MDFFVGLTGNVQIPGGIRRQGNGYAACAPRALNCPDDAIGIHFSNAGLHMWVTRLPYEQVFESIYRYASGIYQRRADCRAAIAGTTHLSAKFRIAASDRSDDAVGQIRPVALPLVIEWPPTDNPNGEYNRGARPHALAGRLMGDRRRLRFQRRQSHFQRHEDQD
jgi:hypothetical protein